jgi:hypothetical protein
MGCKGRIEEARSFSPIKSLKNGSWFWQDVASANENIDRMARARGGLILHAHMQLYLILVRPVS